MLSTRTTARLLLGAALIAIGLLTLIPAGPAAGPEPCSAFALLCGDELWGEDLTLNVLLFVPLGLALGLGQSRGGLRYLVPLGLSVAIELAQATPWIHRDPSLRDVLANASGGALGLALGTHLPSLLRPAGGVAAKLLTGWAALMTVGLLASGSLLLPSVPPGTWYGQWTPELGQFDRFDGRLRGAKFGELPLPAGRIDDTDRFRRAAGDGGYRLAADVIAGPTIPANVAPIASVFDDRERQIAVLGARGPDLAFSGRVVGQDLGFRPLWFFVGPVFAPGRAQSVAIDAGLANGRFVARWHSETGADSARRTVGPADGWQLLIGERIGAAGRTEIGATLVALAFLPLGFYAARIRRGVAPLALSLPPAAVALLGIPFGFPPAGPLAWALALGGLGAGWLAGRQSAREPDSSPSSGAPT